MTTLMSMGTNFYNLLVNTLYVIFKLMKNRLILVQKRGTKINAFSLPELLLATAILAFALCAILLSYINCFFLNESSRNLNIAISHAAYVMEEIKNTDFSSIKANIDNGNWDWSGTDISSRGLTALTNETIDTQVNGTTLLDILVTVNWRERSLRDRNTSVESLIAEP